MMPRNDDSLGRWLGQPLGRLATEHPAAGPVLLRHGLDYCCGGDEPLATACARRGLEAAEILREIGDAEAAPAPAGGRGRRVWTQAAPAELVEYIVASYHEPLRAELPRLELLARKVLAVHGPKDPERLTDLAEALTQLREDLEEHMLFEEEQIFPRFASGRSLQGIPVAELHREHLRVRSYLDTLRRLTDEFTVPTQACSTWRALWEGLQQLDLDLREHVHLENNVLLPMALD